MKQHFNNFFLFFFKQQNNRMSLSELCDDPNDHVLLAFQQLGKIYQEKLNSAT